MIFEESEWYRKIKSSRYIMIFGAANDARITYSLIKPLNVDIDCYIVSERRDNPVSLDDKPVRVFDEINEEMKRDGLVIISQKYENNDKMELLLSRAGFKNMIPGISQVTYALSEDLREYCQSIFGDMLMIEEFTNGDLKSVRTGNANVCIYAVTSHRNQHMSGHLYNSKYIQYIQAGACLTDKKICSIVDNDGDHISELNPYYCELTAGYWIYKNDCIHEYVGLCHYSRGFSITDEQIEDITEAGIDVLLPVPLVFRHEALFRYFASADIIIKAIRGIHPEYLESAEKFFAKKLFFVGNMLLARKSIYCRYYKWMFEVLRECERIMRENEQPVGYRLWGYFGEVLTNIFFMHHANEYKMLYSKIKYMY